MEYDIINLFGEWADKFLFLTFNESAFIKAQWTGYSVIFLDTLRHWMMSVKSMGDFIGLPKLDPGKDFNNVAYCQRDTEIVWQFVKEMTGRYDEIGAVVRNTLPSSAFDFFKKNFCKVDITRPSDEICDMLMGAAYGGRVEIFKTGILEGPVDCYDINSLYPYVMRTNLYPAPATGQMVQSLDLEAEFIASVTVEMPHVSIPCLPVRYDGKLIFPTGKFKGTWTAPEIRQAVADGAVIKDIEWIYEYSDTCRPFEKYVDYIYGLRKSTSDPFMSYTLKIFLNSVFGKFTESGELIIFKDGEMSLLENRPIHSNVALGAYTTAYGRLTLLKALRANEASLCYCDTDSVFLQAAPPLPTGKELGEWKHEGEFSKVHFVLPKTYIAVWDAAYVQKQISKSKSQEEKEKWGHILKNLSSYKAKGIPKAAMKQFFETYTTQYDSPVRFRESKRRHLTPNEWIKKVRSLKSTYSKREVLADGSTSPLLINTL